MAVKLKSFVRGGEPLLRTRGMIGSRSAYGKAPMKQLHGNPLAVSAFGHTGKQINSFDAVIHMQDSPKSASQAVLSRMQITLHANRRAGRYVCYSSCGVVWRVKGVSPCVGIRIYRGMGWNYGGPLIG